MPTPTWTPYTDRCYGHNDGDGNTDTFNAAEKQVWSNFTAHYNSGTGEHDKDGDHFADLLAAFAKYEQYTYTGDASGDDRDISLQDTSIDIAFIRIWEASTGKTWFRSADMAGDLTMDTIGSGGLTDCIQDISTTGQFQVGTVLNVNTRVYYYEVYGS